MSKDDICGTDAAMVYEKFFSVKSIEKESRRITAVASSERVIDRDGEIVSIDAIRRAVAGYMRNPVILAGHSHKLQDGKSPVVGRVVDYSFKGGEFLITVEFAGTPLALEYWNLYRDKFQRAFSIGFRGLKSDYKNIDGRQVRIFTEIELYEISCVAVPSNPAAVSKAKSFILRKKLDAEKQRIFSDDVRYTALLEKIEEFEDGERDSFSQAETELLKEFQEKCSDPAFGFDPDWLVKNGLWDEIDDLSDDGDEDYSKSIVGDSGAFCGDVAAGDDLELNYVDFLG